MSPLKGLRFCRTPLPHSATALSRSPQQRSTCISRLHPLYHSFFRRPLMPDRVRSVSLKRSPDWKTNLSPATSFPVSPHPVSEYPRVLCFLLSRRNLVKHTELPLMVTFSFHGFSISLFVAHELVECYTICLKNSFITDATY